MRREFCIQICMCQTCNLANLNMFNHTYRDKQFDLYILLAVLHSIVDNTDCIPVSLRRPHDRSNPSQNLA